MAIQTKIDKVAGFLREKDGGIISTTYTALLALQQADGLIPGQQYSFPFHTIHWLVDANGNYCNDLVDAPPAPGNITITPDAVGSNPVTWYCKIAYLTEGYRSNWSEEFNYQIGDSTTEVIIDCDEIPLSFDSLFIAIGSETGVYTYIKILLAVPGDIVSPILDETNMISTIDSYSTMIPNGERSIVEGTPETLVLTATSVNTLAKIAYSVDYPGDYIEYNIGDASMQSYAQLYDTDAFISDYRGTITRRRDTLGNDLGFDTNTVKYRRWNITQPDWASGTYNQGDTVMYTDSKIYGAKQEATDIEPTVTANWEDYWEVVVNTAIMGLYLSPAPDTVTINGYTLTIQDATDFQDVLALGEGSLNNVQFGLRIFSYLVLPANSRNNVFNPYLAEYAPFWQAVSEGETVTHHSVDNGVRQTYIDGSNNSMVIGEGYVGMAVGG